MESRFFLKLHCFHSRQDVWLWPAGRGWGAGGGWISLAGKYLVVAFPLKAARRWAFSSGPRTILIQQVKGNCGC
jgi:hypothetical protein